MGKTRKIRSNKLDGEKLLYAASIHWGIFLTPMFMAIMGALLWVYFHPFVGGALILVTLVPIINSTILFATTEYGITNKRIIAFYGLFNTDLLQIGLTKLESAHVEQSFIGQILGYYTVIAQGTGAGTISIPFLSDGNKLKRIMDEILYADDREETVEKLGHQMAQAAEEKKKKSKKK